MDARSIASEIGHYLKGRDDIAQAVTEDAGVAVTTQGGVRYEVLVFMAVDQQVEEPAED